MTGTHQSQPAALADLTPQGHLTLDPLRTEGPDALAPEPSDDILAVKLRRLDLIWENAFHEVTTKTADDLFRCAAAEAPPDLPLPTAAKPIRAILAFLFRHDPVARTVEISPPRTLILESPADAPRVTAFLAKRHFAIARKLASLLVILLATVSAILPDTDDDTDDDDDDAPDHYHCPA